MSIVDLLKLCKCDQDKRLKKFLDMQLKLYSQESSDNFHKAIKELRKQNIPYTVEWRRNITEIGKLIYFCYSIILDLFLLLGIIWAVMNFERFL